MLTYAEREIILSTLKINTSGSLVFGGCMFDGRFVIFTFDLLSGTININCDYIDKDRSYYLSEFLSATLKEIGDEEYVSY